MGKRIATGLSDDDGSKEWSGISSFEQILEVIPNDRASLQALSTTHEYLGDFANAKKYMIRLATVYLSEEDHDACRSLIERFRKYAVGDQKAQMILARLEEFGA